MCLRDLALLPAYLRRNAAAEPARSEEPVEAPTPVDTREREVVAAGR